MSDLGTIFFLLRTPGGRKVFFLSLAIGMPLLLGIGIFVNWMGDREAAQGIPNDYGGVHIRSQGKNGVDDIPPRVMEMIGEYPQRIVTDVNVDTDAQQKIVSARITAYVKDDWPHVAAHYQRTWNPDQPPYESGSRINTIRDGVEWAVDDSTPSPYAPPDPHPDLQKITYGMYPIKD
ncbi:MAG: hypothetical protein LBL59_02240 [Xanthomonadaceae bacterium]|jgi:hypothetical protein|nr:hypothetical protein [Xanthomonadaceae bacterium]